MMIIEQYRKVTYHKQQTVTSIYMILYRAEIVKVGYFRAVMFDFYSVKDS